PSHSLVRIRLQRATECDAARYQILHDDDALLPLGVIVREVAARNSQRQVGHQIAIVPRLFLMHVPQMSAVRFEAALQNYRPRYPGALAGVIEIEADKDFRRCGAQHAHDLKIAKFEVRNLRAQRSLEPFLSYLLDGERMRTNV